MDENRKLKESLKLVKGVIKDSINLRKWVGGIELKRMKEHASIVESTITGYINNNIIITSSEQEKIDSKLFEWDDRINEIEMDFEN